MYVSGGGPYGYWPAPAGRHFGAGSFLVGMQYGLVASHPLLCQFTTGASTLKIVPADDQLSVALCHRSTPYCAKNRSSVEPIRTLIP